MCRTLTLTLTLILSLIPTPTLIPTLILIRPIQAPTLTLNPMFPVPTEETRPVRAMRACPKAKPAAVFLRAGRTPRKRRMHPRRPLCRIASRGRLSRRRAIPPCSRRRHASQGYAQASRRSPSHSAAKRAVDSASVARIRHRFRRSGPLCGPASPPARRNAMPRVRIRRAWRRGGCAFRRTPRRRAPSPAVCGLRSWTFLEFEEKALSQAKAARLVLE